MARGKTAEANSTASIGVEAKLWFAADDLRSNMEAAEYKHVVLGLIHSAAQVAGATDNFR